MSLSWTQIFHLRERLQARAKYSINKVELPNRMEDYSYQLIDAGNFRRIEQVGPYRLIRPAAQAVWPPRGDCRVWEDYHAEFHRNPKGEGQWTYHLGQSIPEKWLVSLVNGLRVWVKPTDFGHLGIFPEHHNLIPLTTAAKNWPSSESKSLKLLNLFGYTGTVSMAAASLGMEVTHVDASKTSVHWAQENAKLNLLPGRIRWIIEDVGKFVAREIRRESRYDAIVLDPPSFGRGTKGELWRIESDLPGLLVDLQQLQSANFSFMQLSAHSQGYTPIALRNLIEPFCPTKNEQAFYCEEMTIKSRIGGTQLPCGACCIYSRT